LGDYPDGLDPKQAEAKRKGIPTLKTFLTEEYAPCVKTHNISGEEAGLMFSLFMLNLHLVSNKCKIKTVL